jgi:hypothetical protein
MKKHPSQNRVDALAQLKTAKTMLTEGEAELASAQEKIRRARRLIEHSADVLRKTWQGKPPATES